jgi:hypothetical protein
MESEIFAMNIPSYLLFFLGQKILILSQSPPNYQLYSKWSFLFHQYNNSEQKVCKCENITWERTPLKWDKETGFMQCKVDEGK